MTPIRFTKCVWNYLWRVVLYLALRQTARGYYACANRVQRVMRWTPTTNMYCVFVDKKQEDGYERTECLRMLKAVREMEKRADWKCPEPTLDGKMPVIAILE